MQPATLGTRSFDSFGIGEKRACYACHFRLFIHSFIHVACVTRKLYSKEELCQLLKGLCNYIELVEVGRKVICEALENPWKDIEDCVQYLVAKREAVDVILTRNEKDFLLSDIQVQNPSSFLNAVL